MTKMVANILPYVLAVTAVGVDDGQRIMPPKYFFTEVERF
jgi:hypothetical protein